MTKKKVNRRSVSMKDIKYLGVKPKFKVLKTQLNMGIKVEKEHTKSKMIAKAIALAHLEEDKKYYTKLKKAGL